MEKLTGNLPVGFMTESAPYSQLVRRTSSGLRPPSPQSGEWKLPLQTVERLQRLVGGEARVEDMVLRFIADRYGARSLVFLPAAVAREALRRPADFLRAAKNHCEPELKF